MEPSDTLRPRRRVAQKASVALLTLIAGLFTVAGLILIAEEPRPDIMEWSDLNAAIGRFLIVISIPAFVAAAAAWSTIRGLQAFAALVAAGYALVFGLFAFWGGTSSGSWFMLTAGLASVAATACLLIVRTIVRRSETSDS
jgi:hypothetical protein